MGHGATLYCEACGAIADLSKAFELDPEYAEAHLGRSDAYGWLKEYEKAIPDYHKVLTLTDDPSIRGIAEDALIRLGAD